MRHRYLLLHPAFTGAVALLAVNDHLLKGHAPGWLTGKLSDFAGVFALSTVLSVVTGRPRLAAALTGGGFLAIKLSTDAAVLVAPLIGGVTRQDPTDLFALAALWPAHSFALQKIDQGHRPIPSRSLLVASSAAVALFSMTATSCSPPPIVERFAVEGGMLFAHISEYSNNRWASSADGGRTWELAPQAPTKRASEFREACTHEQLCFRVIPGSRVEERSPGGPWRTSFQFTEEELRRLDLRTDSTCNSLEDQFNAVSVVRYGDTSHVVVAMGSQGVLHREDTGQWERRSVLEVAPASLQGPSWIATLRFSVLVLGLSSPLILLLGLFRSGRRRAFEAFCLALGGALSLSMVSFFLMALDYTVVGPLLAAASVTVFVASVLLASRPALQDGAEDVPT